MKCENVRCSNEFNPRGIKRFCSRKCKKIISESRTKRKIIYNKENRRKNLVKRYGITVCDFNYLFNNQEGCCAICKKHQTILKETLHIDHDHKTNKVRGLLCRKCNNMIGLAEDDIDILNNAITYLK